MVFKAYKKALTIFYGYNTAPELIKEPRKYLENSPFLGKKARLYYGKMAENWQKSKVPEIAQKVSKWSLKPITRL